MQLQSLIRYYKSEGGLALSAFTALIIAVQVEADTKDKTFAYTTTKATIASILGGFASPVLVPAYSTYVIISEIEDFLFKEHP